MKKFKIIFLCLAFLTSITIISSSQEPLESSIEERITKLEKRYDRFMFIEAIVESKKIIVVALMGGICIGYILYKSSIKASGDIKTNISDEKIDEVG